jgi:selenocysteine-specific elongation factor
VDELTRGEVVTLPGTLAPTRLIDARVQYLASAPKPLAHNAEVDFFVGAVEVPAHVRLLDHEQLKPGDAGWVQLQLARPVAAAKNDRFILRYPSPSITVGGGVVVDPHAATRHRRFRADVVARLETLARGSPEEKIMQFLAARGTIPVSLKEIASGTGLTPEAASPVLAGQVTGGMIVALGASEPRNYLSTASWQSLVGRIGAALDEFHRQYPLRAGLPREELKSRLALAPRVFDQVIDRAELENDLRASEDVLRRPDFSVTFGPELQRKIQALLAQFERAPYTPPSAQEAETAIGGEALSALVAQGQLVRLNESVVLAPRAFEAMRDWVTATIRSEGQVTAGQVRDQFDTSRKYVIALLEYLDEKRITRRVGDARVLR